MSLHGKVVAWFAFFASVIVTMFVLGDYYQSTRALRVALEARAEALSLQAATDLERRYERALAELMEFGRRVANAGAPAAEPALASFDAVRVYRGEQLLLERTGTADQPPASFACVNGSVPFHFEFTSITGQPYRVEATMPAAQFLLPVSAITGHPGSTSVIESSDGTLVLAAGCGDQQSVVPTGLEQRIAAHVKAANRKPNRVIELRPDDSDHLFLVAIAGATHPVWSVAVAFDYDDWAAPFVAARTQYLAIMIGFMLIVLLFTLRMIRVDMRRLSAIAQAADAVGHGRFDVWLPPPTGDEVGRLSLAIGRMVNRLGNTMRQAEITAAMAAVGELATYLSHEIRNPLSSLRLNLQMLRRDLRSGVVAADEQELLDVCLTEMQRLDDVVKTVLDVGRRGRGKTGVCDAHDVIDETVHLMRSKLAGHGVEVRTRLAAHEAEVAIDAAKLKSVLINLILNSVDAMANAADKAITITTEQHVLDDESQLVLRVLDTGPGVPPELETEIFEPFFTTKVEGSGIGLATAFRMVKECHGSLRCIPASGQKTGGEFIVELPLAQMVDEEQEPAALAVAG